MAVDSYLILAGMMCFIMYPTSYTLVTHACILILLFTCFQADVSVQLKAQLFCTAVAVHSVHMHFVLS